MAAHVCLLPNDIWQILSSPSNSRLSMSPTAFIPLPHPRTGIPTLFLPSLRNESENSKNISSSKECILELQHVTPSNPRSWFVGDEVLAEGKLMFLLPVDPVFLLIYILKFFTKDERSGIFRPADDIFEDAALKLEAASLISKESKGSSLHLSSKDIRTFTSMQCCRNVMDKICEAKNVTAEIVVYRFSSDKAVEYLRRKVERLSTLEVVQTSRILIRNLAKDGLTEDGYEDLLELGRVKTACDLVSQYLSPDFRSLLLASYDFKKLDEYYKTLEEEKMCMEAPTNDAKKTKKEQSLDGIVDNKRKKGTIKGTQGVEKLKKVNINGMAKLTTFFGRKS
ncbi:hypothetical protein E1B28_000679 [Marasmius oreades]|uniref:Ribonuclease H2 subunit B n=1 Tax=Marasmius oreades TaxID=181124 RepID=A0A9P8AEE0_9AGAR|nr:uncharacterized protein E1B28_000679 [Marasmius oreades]KAG7098771.1 hypothetical protein E1B28_000679 [Marasmius oreades]